MKGLYAGLLLGGCVALGAGAALSAGTQTQDVLAPEEIAWSAGPASLPAGTPSAILYGDPSKEGLFALRLKFPKGYRIPPHTHPKPGVITVISGSFAFGLGDSLNESKATKVPAGGLFSVESGMTHFGVVDEETVIQINSVGPWGLDYVDPKDDPRKRGSVIGLSARLGRVHDPSQSPTRLAVSISLLV